MRTFSFSESRTAVHIRPPKSNNALTEKIKKYNVDTMMMSPAVSTNQIIKGDRPSYADEKDSRNWLNLRIITEGIDFLLDGFLVYGVCFCLGLDILVCFGLFYL